MTHSTSILPASTHSNLNFNQDSKFVLHYFNYHGLGATIRALLCFGEVLWENQIQPFPEWMETKPTTPFGCIPILKETVISTGEEFAIPESQAIERYLGRKFGLMGDTPREQTLNDIFYAQATVLWVKYTETVLFNFDDVREKALGLFMHRLASWVESCEAHLKENGNTGHFVDNKTTLADIRTAALLDIMMALDTDLVLSATASPGLWKLKQTIDTHPTYAAWRRSPGFESIDQLSEASIAPMRIPLRMAKAHIFS
ncbi:hypothetical protein BGZ74_005134 [Mortierella antarctica]|nr:hypothetical protein BGZ74_005134 [Mortierella antarctica]